MFARKNTKALLALTALAGLTMGNEGCEQAKDRVLKMDVEIGAVSARTITMPSGEKIDFNYVSNSLFYQQIQSNGHFVMMGAIPSASSAQAAAVAKSKLNAKIARGLAKAKDANVSSADEKVLEKFGFMDQLAEKAAALSAPVQSKSSLVSGGLGGTATTTPTTASEVPMCVYDLPHAKLAGEVVSFEANWGVGVGIGYGTDGATIPTGGVAGSVKFKSSRLQMGLRSTHTLTGQILGAAPGVASQSEVNFGLDLASALLGLDFFYKTPLAKVVTSAMDKSLDKVVEDMITQKSAKNSWDDVWESRVIYDPEISDNDTYIAMRGGYRYNMRVGDTFTISNMHYKWENDAKPCESPLKYEIPGNAIAQVEVVQVGDNVAVAKVTKYLAEEIIKPGAQVKILNLYVTPEEAKAKAALAKYQNKK
jgi:hypothetical protein